MSHLQSKAQKKKSIRASAHLHRHDIIVLRLRNNRRRLGNPLAEDVALDDVWQPDKRFVVNVVLGRHGEDLCKQKSAYVPEVSIVTLRVETYGRVLPV